MRRARPVAGARLISGPYSRLAGLLATVAAEHGAGRLYGPDIGSAPEVTSELAEPAPV